MCEKVYGQFAVEEAVRSQVDARQHCTGDRAVDRQELGLEHIAYEACHNNRGNQYLALASVVHLFGTKPCPLDRVASHIFEHCLPISLIIGLPDGVQQGLHPLVAVAGFVCAEHVRSAKIPSVRLSFDYKHPSVLSLFALV